MPGARTSMSPEEVVNASNATLDGGHVARGSRRAVLAVGRRVSGLPEAEEGRRCHPGFTGLALTTDGYATSTYLGSPFKPRREPEVASPAPDLFLLHDSSNGGAFLDRHRRAVRRVTSVDTPIEPTRPAAVVPVPLRGDPRRAHLVRARPGAGDVPPAWTARGATDWTPHDRTPARSRGASDWARATPSRPGGTSTEADGPAPSPTGGRVRWASSGTHRAEARCGGRGATGPRPSTCSWVETGTPRGRCSPEPRPRTESDYVRLTGTPDGGLLAVSVLAAHEDLARRRPPDRRLLPGVRRRSRSGELGQ